MATAENKLAANNSKHEAGIARPGIPETDAPSDFGFLMATTLNASPVLLFPTGSSAAFPTPLNL
jgi:hypothetical protein